MIITTPKTQEAVAFAHEGIKTLTEATATGIRFDMAYAKSKHERLGKRIQSLEKKVANTKLLKTWKKVYGSDMNTASGDQMAHVVYDIMGYTPQHFTAKGKPSTSQEAIEALKIPEIEQFVSLQKLKDARDKVLVNLMKEAVYHDNDWWLHPVFGFSRPATFRGCLVGETKILVVKDFESNPKGIPIKDVKIGDYVYCFDNNLKPAIRKVLWAGKTGCKKVIRVHWRHRSRTGYLDMTPEHLIRHISGKWIEAQNFVGDLREQKESKKSPKRRALACYRNKNDDRLYFTGNTVYEHNLVYNHFYGEVENDKVIHHKDGNHFNHKPSNLAAITPKKHACLHFSISDEDRKRGIKTRIDKIKRGEIVYPKGKDHHAFKAISKLEILKLIAKYGGKVSNINEYDFSKIKSTAKLYKIDLKEVKSRYRSDGSYITKGELIYLHNDDKISFNEKVSILGVNYYKAKRNFKRIGVDIKRKYWGNQFGKTPVNNHIITRIEEVDGIFDVYDLEVENFHNFFANEICVHNSAYNPNFQNIPNRDEKIKKIIRRAIIPRKGHQLVGIDFSKMEICGAYFYHKDPNMYKELTNPKLDMHRDMAMENLLLSKEEMGDKGCPGYSDRRHHAGKNGFIFPQFYGDSPVSCAVNIFIAIDLFELTTAQGLPIRQHLKNKGIITQEDYIEHVKKVAEKFWKVRFPKYYQWRKDWYNQYEKQGWFEMFTGFVCQGYMRRNQVINYPVQGVCFHMLLWVMNELTKLKKKEKWRSQIIGQIHDEVDGDFHEEETKHILGVANELVTKKLAEHWPWITVPMKAEAKLSEVDGDWAHMKEVKL